MLDIPTQEEYEKALADMKFCTDCMCDEKKRLEELLDALVKTRENMKIYEDFFNRCKEIKDIYEIYQEYK